MPIPKVPAPVRNYLYTFGSTSIALTAKGNVIVTANPTGCERAWWLKREDAKRLLPAARVRGDIEGSARRLGIVLTAHDVCMMRADRCLAQLDEILAHAKQSGDLKLFNARYRQGRLRAQARGERFMPYSAAETKLKRLLVEAIADGTQGRPFQFALARVFPEPSGKSSPVGKSCLERC